MSSRNRWLGLTGPAAYPSAYLNWADLFRWKVDRDDPRAVSGHTSSVTERPAARMVLQVLHTKRRTAPAVLDWITWVQLGKQVVTSSLSQRWEHRMVNNSNFEVALHRRGAVPRFWMTERKSLVKKTNNEHK